ncbi:MAG: 50S ribosomal protein L15 [Candidatus Falkowbacteria bacterium]
MTMQLNTLTNKGRGIKKRKIVGRGNASGHGTFSTRGSKGQRARSGGKRGLKLRGLRFTLLRLPKFKGIKSIKPENQAVNLCDIEKKFAVDAIISPVILKEKNLIKRTDLPVKILGIGQITKKVTISNCFVAESAKKKIEAAGGKIE